MIEKARIGEFDYIVETYPVSRVTVITDVTGLEPDEYSNVALIWLPQDGIFTVFTSINVEKLKDLAVKYGGNF